jgi:hypothetical protein
VSAIWAIDINAVKAEAIQLLSQNGVIGDPKGRDSSFGDPDVFDRVFLQRATHIVAPVQPLRMNERATAQQGLFLCPNSSLWGFEFAIETARLKVLLIRPALVIQRIRPPDGLARDEGASTGRSGERETRTFDRCRR